ncbi:MAG: hypothetical protein WC059_00070 [Candidatus Paceibacterota bacterium]
METNRKLKAIYFVWGDEYYAPFPRSWDDTFEHYLFFTRYDDEDWLSKILAECNISTKQEYDDQLVVIEKEYEIYCEQQFKKRQRKEQKRMNIYYENCRKEGVLPF